MVSWKYPNPFTLNIDVHPDDLDGFGHVNNTVYVRWLEQVAWAHSAAVGLSEQACIGLQRGMAVRRTEIDYLRAAVAEDKLVVGNWVIEVSRLRATRWFELFRPSDNALLLQAKIEYVCIDLQTGAPVRFPEPFVQGYRVEPEVRAVLNDRGMVGLITRQG